MDCHGAFFVDPCEDFHFLEFCNNLLPCVSAVSVEHFIARIHKFEHFLTIMNVGWSGGAFENEFGLGIHLHLVFVALVIFEILLRPTSVRVLVCAHLLVL